jgi:hypothetical protein
MAYIAGDKILDDEYITFVNGSTAGAYGINHIQGTGDGVYGMGQTDITTVTAGDTITAAQWNSLFTQMNNAANHTNDSLTSSGGVTTGDSVTIKANLQTDLNTLAASVSGGCTSATAVSESSEKLSLVSSAVFDTSHIVEAVYTFAGGDEARWFFNSGGKLRVKLTNNSTNSTGKDTSVNALITALGNFDIGSLASTRSGTGETVTTDGLANGYHDLSTGYTTLLELTEDSGTYTGNIALKIEAKVSAAHADGRNNNGEVVTVKCSVLLNDVTTTDYTSGNTDTINVEEEAAGTTDWAFHTVDATTAEGLSTVYTTSSVTEGSNTTNNAD